MPDRTRQLSHTGRLKPQSRFVASFRRSGLLPLRAILRSWQTSGGSDCVWQTAPLSTMLLDGSSRSRHFHDGMGSLLSVSYEVAEGLRP
jgi:hypothetical protein